MVVPIQAAKLTQDSQGEARVLLEVASHLNGSVHGGGASIYKQMLVSS